MARGTGCSKAGLWVTWVDRRQSAGGCPLASVDWREFLAGFPSAAWIPGPQCLDLYVPSRLQPRWPMQWTVDSRLLGLVPLIAIPACYSFQLLPPRKGFYRYGGTRPAPALPCLLMDWSPLLCLCPSVRTAFSVNLPLPVRRAVLAYACACDAN